MNDPEANDSSDAPTDPNRGRVSPERCDVDLADPDAFEAVWLTFQRERAARCPASGAELTLALARDPATSDADVAEVMVACPACGQRVQAAPPDAEAVFGWAE